MPARTLLYGVGLGPGAADLMSVRARDVILSADRLVHFCKRGRRGNARTTADAVIAPDPAREIALTYPVTVEAEVGDPAYDGPIAAFYEEVTEQLAREMQAGRVLAVLCDGDPFFYGSFMHLWRRLSPRFPRRSCRAFPPWRADGRPRGAPITWGDDVMTVLPGTLPEAELTRRLADTDAAVIMKLGRHLPRCAARCPPPGWRSARSMSSAPPWPSRPSAGSARRRMTRRRISQWCWCLAKDGGCERLARHRRPRPRHAEWITPRRRPRSRRRAISSAMAPISTGCRSTPGGPSMPPTPRRGRAGGACAATGGAGQARCGRLGRGPRRVRHGGGGVRGAGGGDRRRGARSPSRSSPASPQCWPRRRGRARRWAGISAQSRFRTPQALGGGDRPARGGARRRFRDLPLQPDLEGAALAARQGAGTGGGASRGLDAGALRPRRRAAGRGAARADPGGGDGAGRNGPTWRRW